jgi:hypothetical protein
LPDREQFAFERGDEPEIPIAGANVPRTLARNFLPSGSRLSEDAWSPSRPISASKSLRNF